MKLEAVTVSVNYADFLAESLPLNKIHFDRLVVVTTPEDLDTQRVCEHHNVMCVKTRAFGPPGEFHKACGINQGLKALDLDGWVVHLDADMVLPAQTRQVLERIQLDPRMVYGLDRNIVVGWDEWHAHRRRPRIQQQLDQCLVHVGRFPVGARLNVPKHDGWSPIGFFQLWNPDVSCISEYPSEHVGADRTDMLFSTQWPRGLRGFIPEILAWHLESEPAPQGTNWLGRKTRPFAKGARRRWRLYRPRTPMAVVAGVSTGAVAGLTLIGLVWIAVAVIILNAVIVSALMRCRSEPPNPYCKP